MDNGLVVLVVVGALAVVGLAAIVLRGRMTGDAQVFGLKLKLGAGRDPSDRPGPGQATIEGSTSTEGSASAIGPGGALIKDTTAKGDLTARAIPPDDGGPNPKA